MAGRAISLIVLDNPQRVVRARITGKLKSSCAALREATVQGTLYGLNFRSGLLEPGEFAIALPESWKVSVRNGKVIGSQNGQDAILRFRACATAEGLHLTVWENQPLVGRRLWHQYVYLGYDLEPTCKAVDYE
jgi:hypothetical protein